MALDDKIPEFNSFRYFDIRLNTYRREEDNELMIYVRREVEPLDENGNEIPYRVGQFYKEFVWTDFVANHSDLASALQTIDAYTKAQIDEKYDVDTQS